MKNNLMILIFSLILLTKYSYLIAQEDNGELYYSAEVSVKSGMINEYESVVKEFVKECYENDFPFDFYAYSLEGFKYLFIYKINNYAEIDLIAAGVKELNENIGNSRLNELYSIELPTIKNTVFRTFRYIPELSNTGSKSLLIDENMKYLVWTYMNIYTEMDSKFRELQQEWLTLAKENNINFQWEFFTGGIGFEVPVWIYITGGESAVDYHTQAKSFSEFAHKKGKHLLDLEIPLIRDYREVNGKFRTDLSYIKKSQSR